MTLLALNNWALVSSFLGQTSKFQPISEDKYILQEVALESNEHKVGNSWSVVFWARQASSWTACNLYTAMDRKQETHFRSTDTPPRKIKFYNTCILFYASQWITEISQWNQNW